VDKPAQRVRTKNTEVVIVGRKGPDRGSLRTILSVIPGLTWRGWADSVGSALRLIETCRPHLVLLDTDLPGNQAWILIRQIGSSWPEIDLIVLARNDGHAAHAKELGAKKVLPRATSTTQLLSAIDEIMRRS
jgi:DNA-binding NarL/FixJ family response regulator